MCPGVAQVAFALHCMPISHSIPLTLPAAVATGAIQGLRLVLIPIDGVALSRLMLQWLMVRLVLLLLVTSLAASTATIAVIKVATPIPFIVASSAIGAHLWIRIGMTHGWAQSRVIVGALCHLHGAPERRRRLAPRVSSLRSHAHGSLTRATILGPLGRAGADVAADAPVEETVGERQGVTC